MLRLFPDLEGSIGYFGESFGGGIGALAIPWEPRIKAGHINVPTFGNHELRMSLQNHGSGASLQEFHKTHGNSIYDTLCYYDAASAATFIKQPMHCALAPFDPAVPPAGQYAILQCNDM